MATFSRTSVLGRGLPRPASVNHNDRTRQFLALGARNATRLRARRCGDLRESALAPLAPESLDTARLGRVPPALSATPERGPPTSAPYSALTPPTPGSYRQHGGPRNRRGPLPGPARPELDSLARDTTTQPPSRALRLYHNDRSLSRERSLSPQRPSDRSEGVDPPSDSSPPVNWRGSIFVLT